MRREPLLAALLCLLGSFLVLVAVGREWALIDLLGSGLLPARELGVRGSDLVPGVRALGLVALAGVVAIPATKRWGRTVVGVLLALVGAGVVVATYRVHSDLFVTVTGSAVVREAGGNAGDTMTETVWPYVCAFGGILVAAAGLLVVARGRRWAAMGRRYDPPAAKTAVPPAERDLWEALDRGDDPTAADPEAEGPGPRG
ncbi:MAG: Trp biosynthesis associated, transrane protein Oprn/Chp [Frankiales bacterium]|nr:Trp biosynthesis associated, transrane protein Oprn/Chp [Frankiales bacterium]